MTQDSDLNDRIERLESIVERQQETIETLRTRLVDDLETTLERTRQRLRRLEATTGSGGPIDSEESADV